jgi:hypothetical protein
MASHNYGKNITLSLSILLLSVTSLTATPSDSSENRSTHTDSVVITSASSNKDTNTSDNQQSCPWLSLIGPLIGTLGAGLVALFSVRATHNKALARDQLKSVEQKNIRDSLYCGVLYAIYATMQNHNESSKRILSQLDAIKDRTLEYGRLVVEDLGVRLSLGFLSKCVSQLLTFEQYHTKIGGIAISYLHSAESFNSFLDFSQVHSLKKHVPDDPQFLKGIESYFDNLREHIGKLQKGNADLSELILEELKKFPQINIITEDTAALLHRYVQPPL